MDPDFPETLILVFARYTGEHSPPSTPVSAVTTFGGVFQICGGGELNYVRRFLIPKPAIARLYSTLIDAKRLESLRSSSETESIRRKDVH